MSLAQLNLTFIEMGRLELTHDVAKSGWQKSKSKIKDEFGNVYNSVNELHTKCGIWVSSVGLRQYGETIHKGVKYFRID